MKETDNAKKLDSLGNEKIPRLILSFSSATFAALLFNALYTLTDALVVSRGVSDSAMGGVSIILPFVIIQSAIASTVGGGAASIVSRYLGKKDYFAAGNVTFNAMAVFYITAVIITALGFIFMNPVLSLMGVTEEICAYAKEYYIIILAGNVFSTGFSSIIRAECAKIYSLLIWVIPVSVNILLDFLFVFGFNMGVAGTAAATVLCQFTSFIMSVIYFTRLSCQKFGKIKLSFPVVKEIIAAGLPALIQSGTLSLSSLLINKMLSLTSRTDGIIAFAYISKAVTFAVVPVTAVSQALMPIVGYNFGSGSASRVKQAVSWAFKICYAYSVIALAAALIAPEAFIKIFTADENIIAIGADGIRITAFATLLFSPASSICGAVMQAQGKKKQAFIIYASALVFLLPLIAAAARISLNAIWISYAAAYLLSAVLSLAILKYERKKETLL